MNRLRTPVFFSLVTGLFACASLSFSSGQVPSAKDQSAPSRSASADSLSKPEKEFQKSLDGATLVGHFMVTGQNASEKPRAERYEILGVKKVKADHWEFRARIQYGDHDLTIPLTLPVYWAGDTPVITLDKIPVPGLGTFTARVMIYQDHYAGTWDGGDHGGVMFGKIERQAR